MTDKTRSSPWTQITGNSGVNYAAWQLSRRGWHVIQTIRNARGSDMFITNSDESQFFGVQSKGFHNRPAVPLGPRLESLRSDWWIITTFANSDAPVCYLLTLAEVRALANPNKNGAAWWLEVRDYNKDEFREAWHRLAPNPPSEPSLGG